ncbi:glycosyltransferase [Virgibacillus proomii]|uniref:glycosyltransferase n=1 Tax=Virgibacillus proomii TaxID=84407 RepID=UPI0009877F6C|nr:glycosyltransferase [Virgibacillus proomii]
MLISIIVPIYNAEDFLPKCLESVKNQTYKDLEIILVNDGSTDQSRLICDEYSITDDRFMILHKENGGVSSARNAGLRVAKGKYVIFLDADDWIEPIMIENLFKQITTFKADTSICGYFKEEADGTILNKTIDSRIISYNQLQVLHSLLDSEGFKGYLWNKLLSMDIIKNNKIFFDEDIYFCEDLLFITKYMLHSEKIIYDTTPYYHYVIHENNASQSQFGRKKLTSLDALDNTIKTLKSVEGLELGKYKNFYIHMNISLLMNGIKEKKINREIKMQLKRNLFRYKLSSLPNRFVKLSCMIGRINVCLLYFIWKNIKIKSS